jgi:hypothetical protein
MLKSLPRTAFLTVSVLVLFLASESLVNGQGPGAIQLRGTNKGAGAPLLLPPLPYAPAILNNGSLQTTQNPNANLPNQARFIYIAAMPLGDRLGLNGVYYDNNILPNNGMFNGGINIFATNQAAGINNMPLNGARFARTPMMPLMGMYPMGMGMYPNYNYMGMQMMQAYSAAMMMQAYSGSFGGFDASGGFLNTVGAPGAGFVAPMNNQGFGAGFANVGGGF